MVKKQKYLLVVLFPCFLFLFSGCLSRSCNSLHNVAISLSMSSIERSLLKEYLALDLLVLQLDGLKKKYNNA